MDLNKLSKCGKLITFSKGEFVCIEKQPGETAYLLLQGKAKVVLGSFSDRNREMANIPQGTIFGEMSLLEGNPRSATIVADEDNTIVLEIGKDDFLQLINTEPELAYNLLRVMYNRIENSLSENRGYFVAFDAEIHRDQMYNQISKLDLEQFKMIVEQDNRYILKLLKYLSHLLSRINIKVMEVSSK